MKSQETAKPNPEGALARLVEREEVLEICYWYKGEGLGDRLTPAAVLPFMASDPELVAEVFDLLVEDGDFVAENGAYDFTTAGKKKAARLFHDSFTEFQLGSHGECTAGCCDGDEECDHEHHGHGPLAGHGAP